MKFADYIYSTTNDTVRFCVAKNGGEWDVMVFFKDSTTSSLYKNLYSATEPVAVFTFSTEAASLFKKKRDAVDWIKDNFGGLKSINPQGDVTSGWDKFC